MNGALVTVGWSYVAVDNAVVFTEQTAPEAGDIVRITYGYFEECP